MDKEKGFMEEIDALMQEFASKIRSEINSGNMDQNNNITALAALITARANLQEKSLDLDGLNETVKYLEDHLATQLNPNNLTNHSNSQHKTCGNINFCRYHSIV